VTVERPKSTPKPRRATAIAKQKRAPIRRTATPAPPAPQNPIQLGESAWGPVKGYVATNSSTGTKTSTPIVETPQSISVVTREQIDDQKTRSVQETLRYTAGVRAEAAGFQTITDVGALIRGFRQDAGSLYVDSMRLSTNGHLGFSSPDLYGFERVEVLRGAASILYGQNSPGGIVNAVSKRPTNQPFHELEIQGGSFGRKQIAGDFSGPLDPAGQWSYRLLAVGRDSDTQVDYVRDNRAFIATALTWRPSARTNVTFLANHQRDESLFLFGLPADGTVLPNPNGRIPMNRFVGEPDFDKVKIGRSAVGYLAEHHAGEFWTLRQNLRYTRHDYRDQSIFQFGFVDDGRQRTVNRATFARLANVDVLTVDNQAQAKFVTGAFNHTLLLGIDYLRFAQDVRTGSGPAPALDVFTPSHGEPIVFPGYQSASDQLIQQTGFYVQNQIKFDDKWVLVMGGRRDRASSNTNTINLSTLARARMDQDDQAFTKRVGLLYLSDIGLAPYVSYSESFEPQGGVDRLGASFVPTTGRQREVGVKFEPRGTNILLTLAAFDLTRQNVLTRDPVDPNFSVQTGEVRSRGIEIEVKASLSNGLDLIAAVTRTNVEVTKDNDPALVGRVPTGVPADMASLWGKYRIESGPLTGVGFGAGVRYVGWSFGDQTNTFQVPAVTLFDAALYYDFGQYRFALNATNLFDTYNVASCSSQTQCNFGTRRTFIGSLRYRW
jgi:iron complex outermembrane receptor protein